MADRVLGPNGKEDLRYVYTAVNIFAGANVTGIIRSDLPRGERQAVLDINQAIVMLNADMMTPREEHTFETWNAASLLKERIAVVVGGGIEGFFRRRSAANYLSSVLATSDYPGQEPWRYDQSLPETMPSELLALI